MRRKQKHLEEYILVRFAEKLRLPIISIEESETPDFYIKTLLPNNLNKKKSISIELTDVINPVLKKQEVIQDEIIKIAKDKFINNFPDVNLNVKVEFLKYHLPKRKPEIEKLANDLYDYIETIYKNNLEFEFRIMSKGKFQSNCIYKIYVDNESNSIIWQSVGAHLVPYVNKEWLFNKIDKKNKLIERYELRTDERWLLLVSHYGHKSSAYRYENIKIEDEFDFDKIYFYEYFSQDIVELK